MVLQRRKNEVKDFAMTHRVNKSGELRCMVRTGGELLKEVRK